MSASASSSIYRWTMSDSRRFRPRIASIELLSDAFFRSKGAAFGGVPQLHGGHDVQRPVDLPVPGPGEPVADLVAGGGVDEGGAVPGREVRPAGEPKVANLRLSLSS